MRPGDFSKYAATRVPKSLADRVRRALGNRAVRRGELVLPEGMDMVGANTALERAGVKLQKSRFPGFDPFLSPRGAATRPPYTAPHFREGAGTKFPAVDQDRNPIGSLIYDATAHDQAFPNFVRERRRRLLELARSKGLDVPDMKSGYPLRSDKPSQLEDYLVDKPFAFEESSRGQTLRGLGPGRAHDRSWADRKYRSTPESIKREYLLHT